jgi:hypothetical protein
MWRVILALVQSELSFSRRARIERAARVCKRFAITLALLFALPAAPAKAGGFPVGDVFRPVVADPTEPRFFVKALALKTATERTTIASVGFGGSFGFYRWPGERPGEGWQAGIFGGVNSQFDLQAESKDLINTDFRVGFPLTYKRGRFSARARIFHQSSHLGDELLLSGNAPQRINLSLESFDFVVAWEADGWRPYAGGYYLLYSNEDIEKRPGLQAGLDYAGRAPLLVGGRLVGGVNVKWFDELNWRPGVSVKLGLEYGRPYPERRGITVLLEAYDGASPFGQFYLSNVKYYGLGVQFDL